MLGAFVDALREAGEPGAAVLVSSVVARIGMANHEAIAAAKADIVVTDCPGCQVQLIDTTTRHKMPQQVRHIMELLD